MRNFVKLSHCKIFGQSVGSDMQLMTPDVGVCWKFPNTSDDRVLSELPGTKLWQRVPPNSLQTPTRLYGVTFHKTSIFNCTSA
jgi:hypothetical protein